MHSWSAAALLLEKPSDSLRRTCAVDVIHSSLLRKEAPSICPFHLYFLSLSPHIGSLPSPFKSAHVSLVLKTSPYSPVALQPSLSPFTAKLLWAAYTLSLLSHIPLSLHPTDILHWTFGSCRYSRFRPHHFTKSAQLGPQWPPYLFTRRTHFKG